MASKGKMYNMKNMFAICAVVSVLLGSIGCKDKQKLYVYTWADYIDPDLIESFENENNCKVVIDTFDSNETMFAKLMAGGTGYDIITPTEYIMNLLVTNNLVDKIDPSQLPMATKNIDPMFASEWTFKYSVPYAFSCTGIMWRKDKVPDDADFKDWNDMFSMKFQGRICMMDDIREVIGLGLKMNGYSVNSTSELEISNAVQTILKFKSRCSKMDNEAYRTGIPSGEFYAAMAYNSDAVMLLADNPEQIGYSIPTNGTASSMDVFCLTKTSSLASKALAYKFIDMFFDVSNAVKNAAYNCTPMPVAGVYDALPEKYKSIPCMRVTPELRARCEDIKDVGDSIGIYNKAWDAIKRSN